VTPDVELIFDRDCPNVDAARENLLRAFARAGLAPAWVEYDRADRDSPDHVRRYGSPTILVEGRDVASQGPEPEADCCRLYDHGGGKLQGAPAVEVVAKALGGEAGEPPVPGRASGGVWHGSAPALLGSTAAVLPTCPACWPVYAGVLSAAGVGFVVEEFVVLPLMAALLALTLFLLGFRARQRRGHGPLWLGVGATVLVLAGKLAIASDPLVYAGLALLVAAALWNALPARRSPTGHALRASRIRVRSGRQGQAEAADDGRRTEGENLGRGMPGVP
jgi:hypothetical protein